MTFNKRNVVSALSVAGMAGVLLFAGMFANMMVSNTKHIHGRNKTGPHLILQGRRWLRASWNLLRLNSDRMEHKSCLGIHDQTTE